MVQTGVAMLLLLSMLYRGSSSVMTQLSMLYRDSSSVTTQYTPRGKLGKGQNRMQYLKYITRLCATDIDWPCNSTLGHLTRGIIIHQFCNRAVHANSADHRCM